MTKRVILTVVVDVAFNDEQQFWARLALAKSMLKGKEITDAVNARDAVTHNIANLNFGV